MESEVVEFKIEDKKDPVSQINPFLESQPSEIRSVSRIGSQDKEACENNRKKTFRRKTLMQPSKVVKVELDQESLAPLREVETQHLTMFVYKKDSSKSMIQFKLIIDYEEELQLWRF
jgi:hypothetical protein